MFQTAAVSLPIHGGRLDTREKEAGAGPLQQRCWPPSFPEEGTEPTVGGGEGAS